MVLGQKPISQLQPSAACLAVVRDFESFRDKAYLCPAGVWTIGYGSTWNFRNGRGVKPGDTTTREEAEHELMRDLQVAVNDVRKHLPSGIALTQGQFDGLVSFAYNMGGPNFSKSRVCRALERGDINAAAEGFKAHVTGNGQRLNGLVRRREAESALFTSGVPTDGRGNILAADGISTAGMTMPISQPVRSANYINIDTVNASWIELAMRQGKEIPMMDAPPPADQGIDVNQLYASINPTPPATNSNPMLMNAISTAGMTNISARYSQEHNKSIHNPELKGYTDCSWFTRYVMDKYLGLDREWSVSGTMAKGYSDDFGLPFSQLKGSEITADRLPLYGIVSMLKHRRDLTNNHVVMLTVGPDGNRYVVHSTSGRGSDGKDGVDVVPLERYLDDFRSRRLGIEIADLTGRVTGNHSYSMMLAMQDARSNRMTGAPLLDSEFKKGLLRDALLTPSLGLTTEPDGSIILNGLIFQLAFDEKRNAAIQGSEVLQTAANQFLINIPANMTASWAMYSAITKMAKQAGMDVGQLQIDMAKEMIRTKGDDSYYRFLQRTPDEYGFGKYKNAPIPTQAQLQAEHEERQQRAPSPPSTPQQQYVATTPEQDRQAAMRQAGQNAQNVNFATGGQEAPQGRVAAEFDPRKIMAEAYEMLPVTIKNQYSITGEAGKTMLLPTDDKGTPFMPAQMRNMPHAEMFEVFNNEKPQDLAERILGRHQMNLATQAQNLEQNSNVTQFRPLTPA